MNEAFGGVWIIGVQWSDWWSLFLANGMISETGYGKQAILYHQSSLEIIQVWHEKNHKLLWGIGKVI